MVAPLRNLSISEDEDDIGVLNRRESMRDRDRRSVLRSLVERRLDDFLGFGIEC